MSTKHLLHEFKISSRVPAAVKVVIFVSYTALVAALVGIGEHAVIENMAQQPMPWVVALVALCTLSVSILVLQLSDRIEDLHRLHRIRFKYYPAGGIDKPTVSADMYEAARRVISGAREDGTCEIMALNSFHEKFDPLEDDGAHGRYFETLNAKLKKVHYQRFVQCETREQLVANLSDSKEYRDHFEQVIAERDDRSNSESQRMRLDMVAPTFPTAFIIVKHANGPVDLIWQLNEYTGDTRDDRPVFRVRGLLHVTDPDKRLIRYFEGWFNRLANASAQRITRSFLYADANAQPPQK